MLLCVPSLSFLFFSFHLFNKNCKQSSKNHSSHLFFHYDHHHHHFGCFFRISHISSMFLLCFHSSIHFYVQLWMLAPQRSTYNSFQLLVFFLLLPLFFFICLRRCGFNERFQIWLHNVTWLRLQLVQTANNNGSDSLWNDVASGKTWTIGPLKFIRRNVCIRFGWFFFPFFFVFIPFFSFSLHLLFVIIESHNNKQHIYRLRAMNFMRIRSTLNNHKTN